MSAAPVEDEGSEGTERVTVSLPRQVARALRVAAKEDRTSVSGLVASSLRDRLRVRGMRKYLDEYQAEFGKITDEEIAAVRREAEERSAPWR